MDAYQLLKEIANSSENDETIKDTIAQFSNFMNETAVKRDELRIPLQQGINSDKAEMNKDFLAPFLSRVQSFLISNFDFELTSKK